MKLTRLATLILAFFLSAELAHGDSMETAVANHLARVRDYEARRVQMAKLMRDRLLGAALTSQLRSKADQERERLRLEFAGTRKKEDPQTDIKRDASYEAEIARREKENDKIRQAYVAERERIRAAIARLPQIDPMKEYDLVPAP